MSTDETLAETIRENAVNPAESQQDGTRVREQPLRDQIEADRYLEAKKAARKRHRGLFHTRIVPPGSI